MGLHAPAAISESGIEIEQAPWDGPIAAQLVHSQRWVQLAAVRRPFTPIIPRGAPGSFDAGCILCSADRPLIHGDEVWHDYTAVNTMHGGPMPPKTVSIGRLRHCAWTALSRWTPAISAASMETVPLQSGGRAAGSA